MSITINTNLHSDSLVNKKEFFNGIEVLSLSAYYVEDDYNCFFYKREDIIYLIQSGLLNDGYLIEQLEDIVYKQNTNVSLIL